LSSFDFGCQSWWSGRALGEEWWEEEEQVVEGVQEPGGGGADVKIEGRRENTPECDVMEGVTFFDNPFHELLDPATMLIRHLKWECGVRKGDPIEICYHNYRITMPSDAYLSYFVDHCTLLLRFPTIFHT
jgi:hypothetical protein